MGELEYVICIGQIHFRESVTVPGIHSILKRDNLGRRNRSQVSNRRTQGCPCNLPMNPNCNCQLSLFYLLLYVTFQSSCLAWVTQQKLRLSYSRQVRSFKSPVVLRSTDEDEVAHAHRIMWKQHARKRQAMQYRIIAAEACESMAKAMQEVRVIP